MAEAKWTKERPTETGLYFYAPYNDDVVEVCEVWRAISRNVDAWLIKFAFEGDNDYASDDLNDYEGYWQRIVEPQPPTQPEQEKVGVTP